MGAETIELIIPKKAPLKNTFIVLSHHGPFFSMGFLRSPSNRIAKPQPNAIV